MSRALASFALLVAAGCSQAAPKADGDRFHLDRRGPDTIAIVPKPGQLPFCMAFSASDRGVVRHLTMSPKNEAFKCDASQPVAATTYKIPAEEGPVRIIVVFTDAQIEATPIAAQVREISFKQRKVSGMDLRAPGVVAVDSVDFTPTAP